MQRIERGAGEGAARGFRFPAARILLFAKAPVPGLAKTRLIPALGAEGAARLHQALMVATLARLHRARIAPMELWCAPDAAHPLFARLAADYGVTLYAQAGADLGARLLHAAQDAATRGQAVALIGCDCPELQPEHLGAALGPLCAEPPVADAVLGPAADGGYVLLALRRPRARLFTDMPWGGAEVAETTRGRLRELGWRWQELPVLRDLDRPEDLGWYRALELAAVGDG